ncbi:transposase [Halosaccharopolyspora lacisalsi]|nr:transposase [Halosaccharopolyspora lacisalsi]
MRLKVRTWACAGCGTTHDRDVNAAANIKAAGLAASACGAGVRPQRETFRTGQSAEKRELSGASREGFPGPRPGNSRTDDLTRAQHPREWTSFRTGEGPSWAGASRRRL